MMTIDDLCALLDGLEIPWSNEGYTDDDRPQPPYISLEAGLVETAYADNKVWASWMTYEILLYTRHRSYELESKIEKALEDAGCAFSESVAHADNEDMIVASFVVAVTE